MLFGTAKRCITPPMPVRLAGYASRTTAFETVKEDIYLRVHVHRTAEAQLVFVYGDLIWWNPSFVDKARERLQRELGLTPETVFFLASHNHSGPPTGNTFVPQLEKGDAGYTEYLLEETVLGVSHALEHLDEVTVWRFNGASALNVYRRVKKGDRMVMEPNFQVKADSTLTLLGFLGADGEMKGLAVHYACHANLSAENTVQPDYPGIALRLLDEAYPEGVAMFWQGCTGDLRPINVLGRHFESGDYGKAQEFARDFFEDCQKALAQSGSKVEEKPVFRCARVPLPLENTRSGEELRECLTCNDAVKQEWARRVLEKGNPETEPLRIKYLSYGEGLSVYFFDAELSQAYAAYARSLIPGALCTAYTDGMAGYVCTEEQIREGGYEPVGSARYFALGGTFAPAVEGLIRGKMKELAQRPDCSGEK